MDFKIDTKSNYTIITPQSNILDANLAGAIGEKVNEFREEGFENFVIALDPCTNVTDGMNAFHQFMKMHKDCYSNGQSLVFTGVQDGLLSEMKKEQMHLTLNLTPTMDEAIDIISMEILERDLFNEEA